MNRKLEITEEDAKKEYKSASPVIKKILETSFGKDFFKEKISDKIQTFSDILRELNIEDAVPYKGSRLTELEKSLNAQWRASKIAEVYNRGKIFNWNNSSQYKYFIYSALNGVSRVLCVYFWGFYVGCPAGLAFYDINDAKDAMKKFPEIYNDFLMVK